MVERNLAKVEVASSSLVFRSKETHATRGFFRFYRLHLSAFFESPGGGMVDTQDLRQNLSAPGEIRDAEPLKFGEAFAAVSSMVIPSQVFRLSGKKV